MKHIRISARAILADIEAGMADAALMEKYGLSVRSLPKVKSAVRKLTSTPAYEAEPTNGCPVSERISISAKDFIKTFRATPDDFALMKRYSLSPELLKSVYEQLLAKRVLSEYEFHHRERKCAELHQMELPEIEDSTAIDLTQELSGALEDYRKIEDVPVRSLAAKRESWVVDGPFPSEDPRAGSQGSRRGHSEGPCPKCGRPRPDEYADSCPYCGVVFAKVKTDKKRGGPAVWE